MLSFWQQDAFFSPADVVIIGAGFAGLWCAYELKTRQPNLKITVLEKESFPGGASVRNAGFACFGSPGELLADAGKIGEESVWQTVGMRYRGIQKLRHILGDEAIDYDPCGGYECFSSSAAFQPVQQKLEWLNKGMKEMTGINAAFTIAEEAPETIGVKNFSHVISNRLEGGLHSGKALKTLLQKVIALGVTVLFGMPVQRWENTGNGISIFIHQKEEIVLNTRQLLIAANAFTTTLADALPVQPARGQMILTKPIANLPLKGTFHFDEGFYYWRNVGNRILLGGARNTDFTAENTYDQHTTDSVQQALQHFLHQHIHLPEETEIKMEYRWAGIMGFTDTKKPLIAQPAAGVWAVVACNGMGVALTPVMAEAIARQMLV